MATHHISCPTIIQQEYIEERDRIDTKLSTLYTKMTKRDRERWDKQLEKAKEAEKKEKEKENANTTSSNGATTGKADLEKRISTK